MKGIEERAVDWKTEQSMLPNLPNPEKRASPQKIKKCMDFRGLWDRNKRLYILPCHQPQKKRKKVGAEEVLREKMAENFVDLTKDKNLEMHELSKPQGE